MDKNDKIKKIRQSIKNIMKLQKEYAGLDEYGRQIIEINKKYGKNS